MANSKKEYYYTIRIYGGYAQSDVLVDETELYATNDEEAKQLALEELHDTYDYDFDELDECGYEVEILSSDNPESSVYEDEEDEDE